MTERDTAPETPFAPAPRIAAVGEAALLVTFGDRWDPRVNRAALAFDAALARRNLAGVTETVPTIASVLVRFDPLVRAPHVLRQDLAEMLAARDWYDAPPPPGRRRLTLPAVYGGDAGPDLAEVADLLGLREDQVGDAHAEGPLTVAMLGFAPGCAYLAGLGATWDLPRRKTLRPSVPAGAILVAVRQTVLPANPMPTGWRWIGRTPARTFSPEASEPFLLRPGDEVSFAPVTEAEAARLGPGPLATEVLA